MNFEETLRALAKRQPTMTLAAAVELVDDGGRTLTISLEGMDVEAHALWIATQDDIVALIPNKKINAIKEVRARSYLGLKEAKEAVEYYEAHPDLADRVPVTEAEEQEAIASILGQHNHVTRDIKPKGGCPACDAFHATQHAHTPRDA